MMDIINILIYLYILFMFLGIFIIIYYVINQKRCDNTGTKLKLRANSKKNSGGENHNG